MFRKARREKSKLRLALIGPSGSGKTYSSLLVARGMGGSIAMIDTERGSGNLYSDVADYDICELEPPFSPERYIQAIKEAESAGYDVLIIDSLSHAWSGQGGILEFVDQATKAEKNNFEAWRQASPKHNSLVDALIQSRCHIIATMRSKTAWEVQKDERTGKTKPVKIGLAPVQREGLEYEFTCVLDISLEGHVASASKDRTSLFDSQYFVPGEETGKSLKQWLEAGAEPARESPRPAAAPAPGETTPRADAPGPGQKQGKPATQAQVRKINALCGELGITDRSDRLEKINTWLQQRNKPRVESTRELEKEDASALIELLQSHAEQLRYMQSKEEAQPEAAG